jgi:hypothetical protein
MKLFKINADKVAWVKFLTEFLKEEINMPGDCDVRMREAAAGNREDLQTAVRDMRRAYRPRVILIGRRGDEREVAVGRRSDLTLAGFGISPFVREVGRGTDVSRRSNILDRAGLEWMPLRDILTIPDVPPENSKSVNGRLDNLTGNIWGNITQRGVALVDRIYLRPECRPGGQTPLKGLSLLAGGLHSEREVQRQFYDAGLRCFGDMQPADIVLNGELLTRTAHLEAVSTAVFGEAAQHWPNATATRFLAIPPSVREVVSWRQESGPGQRLGYEESTASRFAMGACRQHVGALGMLFEQMRTFQVLTRGMVELALLRESSAG